MSQLILPEVTQAEAYHRDHYILIRNSKTEKIVDAIKDTLAKTNSRQAVGETPDFGIFLDRLSEFVTRAKVIIALGDSTTANYNNWAEIIARNRFGFDEDLVVINLSDWGTGACDHVMRLEYVLEWLKYYECDEVRVVFLGGLIDTSGRLQRYNLGTGFIPIEAESGLHDFGEELARLQEEIPIDRAAADRWIARRCLAAVEILERICTREGKGFTAILQPMCFDDYAPAYIRELRTRYGWQPDPPPFEDWCRKASYSLDVSAKFELDLKPTFEALRRAWGRRTAGRSSHGNFVDLSMLFSEETTCCYQAHFDAIHYNSLGAKLLAEAIANILWVELSASSADGRAQDAVT